ncbi:MAG: 4-(cytidine 5'-diphospho)-2-C-methyl-D-erythritol kinase [Chlorobi bacterium]|nr:MAG: 4-diphosphocytidyl-2-C-methyl-D-erythritol kinase [Chlorobi bacterium OLB7]MBK8910906.1 4-(cytidine 5'-diphospho)-2-C-methyl-D-erythritol kinase [Chlorobiota bacterium]MBX7218086.1 4-(cytidine 5'-diphospho)-2-C-methyl-D-erythritol kinase [Candidatus Kapabacteria bacterium]
MTAPAMLKLHAPAKINLGLEILRRRPDGYHDLNTTFASLALFDTVILTLRSDDKLTLQIAGNDALSAGQDNLCLKAALLLRQAANTPMLGMDIHLTKRIPTGGGLGGGSADAAAVLIGAAHLWKQNISPETLHRLGLMLGSDVPFFLEGGVAHATGRGEVLLPDSITLPWWVLLVNPGIHVPTPWAFRAVNRTTERAATNIMALLRDGVANPVILRDRMVNDFEEIVMLEHPAIGQIKAELYAAGAAFALMSGSGSTLFGLFPTQEAANAASTHFLEYWTAVVRFHRGGIVVEEG